MKVQQTFPSEVVPAADLRTWANVVTGFRTVAGLAVFAAAAQRDSATLNLLGLALYWVLDILDGWLARVFDQETRFGAQVDILADRLLVAAFYVNFATFHPELLPVILLFLFEFMGLDHYLSNQFIRWPIVSPNYFHQVDRVIWRLNWSAPAKILNSGLVTALLVLTQSAWLALPVVLCLVAVKVYSCARLHRLPVPGAPAPPR